jgi:hypothetical protein
MKTLALIVAAFVMAGTQSAAPSVAGIWTAQFEGRVFVRLELTGASGAVKGGITLGNVEFDKAGAVRRATNAPSELKPISDVAQRGSVLTFAVAGSDEDDRFEFRVLDAGGAELRLILSDEMRDEMLEQGIKTLQPILLTRR